MRKNKIRKSKTAYLVTDLTMTPLDTEAESTPKKTIRYKRFNQKIRKILYTKVRKSPSNDEVPDDTILRVTRIIFPKGCNR